MTPTPSTSRHRQADHDGYSDGHAGRFPVPPQDAELRRMYFRAYDAGKVAARKEIVSVGAGGYCTKQILRK